MTDIDAREAARALSDINGGGLILSGLWMRWSE